MVNSIFFWFSFLEGWPLRVTWLDLFGMLRARNISLFFGAGICVEAWLDLALVLNFEDRCSNLLVYHAASINLEEERYRFFGISCVLRCAMTSTTTLLLLDHTVEGEISFCKRLAFVLVVVGATKSARENLGST